MTNLDARVCRLESRSGGTNHFIWQPTEAADAVQIGQQVTRRLPGESIQGLLDRAIRCYPDKRAKLVVVGWQPGELAA